jgi:plastocyanin
MTTTSILQRAAIALLAGALAMGAACGDDNEDTTAASQQTPSTSAAAAATTTTVAATTTTGAANKITIQNFTFSGIDSAKANTNWTVTNQDSVPHTVSADDGSFKFDVAAGETKSFTKPLAAGSYPIHCDVHPSRMKGTLVVK